MAKTNLKPKKEKTDKALLITSIVLTVIMLIGLVFSLILWQSVEDLLHPVTTDDGADASEQAGRAIAAVFVGILLIPIWIVAEIITLAFDIPSLIMSSTLCGRLAHNKSYTKISPTTTLLVEGSDGGKILNVTEVDKSSKGMLIASIVLIALNAAAIATLVITTLVVIL